MSTTPVTKGLQDVIAGESSICYIDGDRGILAYRGIDIHELAEKSSFEEVCYLLWYAKLPTRQQLADFRSILPSSLC
jgi:citrate synthase